MSINHLSGFGFGFVVSDGVFAAMVDILNANLARATKRTGSFYATDAVIADGETIGQVDINEAVLEGHRRATTVADGAGHEEVFTVATSVDAGWTDNGGGVFTGVATSGSVLQTAIYSALDGFVFNHTVEILSYTSGSIQQRAGAFGPTLSALGEFINDLTFDGSNTAKILQGNNFTGIVKVQSIKKTIPKWYNTDADGAPLPDLRGLSVADLAVNLTTWSEEIDNAAWVAASGSVVANQALAPDGELTADLVTVDVDAGHVSHAQTFTAVEQTFSIYLRSVSGSGTYGINWYDGSHNRVLVNLTELWERFSITFTPLATGGFVYAGDARIAGDSLLTAFAWGAQLEIGPVATPYIKTEATTETRDADEWTEPTSRLPITASNGAIKLQISPSIAGQTKYLFYSEVDANNHLAITTDAATVYLTKTVATVAHTASFLYTHLKDTLFDLEAFWDDTDAMGIRAAAVSGDISSETFGTDADVQDAPLGATVQHRQHNGADFFQSTTKSSESYASKTYGGW